MADNVESRIDLNIDVSNALASIKTLQAQISAFHQSIRNSGNAVNQAVSDNLTKNLLNSINATQKFSASLTTVNDSAQSFTNALERNKLSMGQYFRFAGGASKNFGRLFRNEFDTIEKVARERVKTLQTQYIRMGRDANGALEAIKVRPLRLDMEQLGTQVAMTAQKQQMFNQLVKQGSTNLLNFGKNTQWAGRQLMVGFTIPLSIMGGMAIKEFEKIEKQAIRFRRVYGDAFSTDAETEAALTNIRKLATEFTKYGVEVEKTMELAADAAQMGLKGAALNAQVAEATRLAVLGEVEQQEALKATIAVTNTFGIAADDLAEKINFLNAVENETLTAISDLTIAIPKAGPVVKQLGGSVEDLAFFLTAMKEGGINASEGANALKSALSKVINPTEKASEMLRGYGINLNSIVEGNAGDIKTTILELGAAFDRLDPLSRSRAIEQLFGTFQFARISTLFNNISKEGGQAAKVLELTRASAAELAILSERELKRVEDSPIFKFEKAIERLQESLAPLGVEFIKIITPLIEFGTKILKSFNQMDEGAKEFVTNIVAVLGLIAPVAIMTFGLIANGIANFIKGVSFVGSLLGKVAGAGTGLNQMTQYMTQEQLEATAAASALGQAHSMLTTAFNVEKVALDGLVGSYNNAITAINRYNVASQSRSRPGETPTTRAYARGVLSVPGPKGAGDVIPAMLSPGEAVIPAKEAEKYRGFISQMISGNIPGFSKGVMLGMPRSGKAVAKDRENAQAIFQNFKRSKYANVPPTEYGHQLAKTTGHSFPLFGVGGVYLAPSGKKVFVKPVLDETAAMAEMRGTQIARQAHGLKAPQQRVVVMRDPYDTKRQRKFLALESDLDATFVNNDPKSVFNEDQYFRQLVASLVRVDKDLAASNMFADVVADVGPAGVFSRASGARDYTSDLPSMEQQAMINLLGVKGGAKRAFAESTVGLMAGLSPQQYHQKMITEIQRVLPALRQTIAGFGLTDQREIDAYTGMVKRLEQGLSVDWSKFHAIHSGVKVTAPKPRQTDTPIRGYADGVVSVPGPKGKGDVIPAMLSPGEAVIPAKKAKKYNSLIKAMIAGKVPGFNGGTLGAGLSFPKMDQKSLAVVIKEAETYASLGQEEASVAQQAIKSLSSQKQQSMKDWRRILALTGVEAGQGSQNQILNKALMETYPDSKARKSQFKGFRGSQAGTAQSLIPKYGLEEEAKVASTVSKGAYESLVSQGMSPDEAFRTTQYDPSKPGSGVALGHKVDVGSGKLLPEGWQKEFINADPYLENSVLSSMTSTDKTSTTQVFDAYESAAKALQEKKEIAEAEWRSLEGAIRGDKSFTEGQRKTFAKVNEQVAKTGPSESATTMRAKALQQGYSDADIQNVSGYRSQSSDAEIKAAGQKLTEAKKTKLGGDSVITPEQKAKIEEDGRNLIDGLLNAIDETARMASPSREMYDRGKNLVRGILDGVADGYRESSNQTLSSAPDYPPDPFAPPPGFETTPQPTEPPSDSERGRSIGQRLYSKTEKFLENQIYGDGSFSKTSMGKNLKSAFDANNGTLDDQLAYIEGETQLERSKRELLVQQRNVQAVNAGQYSQVGQLLDEEQMNIAKQGSLLAQEQSLMMQEEINLYNEDGSLKTRKQLLAEERSLEDQKKANNASERQTLKQKRAQDRQSRAGKALGVLGTASMVAGMASGVEGKVGEIAQKVTPALFGLSAIAPMLMALPGPLALLAIAAGAVAFGFHKWNEMITKSREEGTALANALTMSTEKLIALSEATGKVSATEERGRKQEDQLAGDDSVARKFGQTFLESGAGKQFMDDISTVTSSGLGKEESAKSAGRQLATMMAQGLISSGEAASIASAIGTEINDYNFAAEIVGTLIELTGPNGEDLTKEPLRVVTELQEAGMQQFTSFTDLAFDTEAIESRAMDNTMDKRVETLMEIANQLNSDDFVERTTGSLRNLGEWLSGNMNRELEEYIFNDPTVNEEGIRSRLGDPNEFQVDVEISKENARLQAASVQLAINQVQQNQQLADSLEKQYDQKIKQKEEELASANSAEEKLRIETELSNLYAKRGQDIEQFNIANGQSLQQIIDMRDKFDPKVFDDAIKVSALSQFEEDDPMRVFAEEAIKNLNLLEDSEFKTQIQLGFASNELSVDAVNALLSAKDIDQNVGVNFDAIVDKRGMADSNQLLSLITKAGLSPEGMAAYVKIFTEAESDEDFDDKLEALAQIANMRKEYGFKIDLEASSNAGTLDEVTSAVRALRNQPAVMTKQMVIDAAAKDPVTYAGIIENWNTIVGAADVINKSVIIDFRATGDMASVNRYFTEELKLDSGSRAAYFRSMAIDPAFDQKIRNEAAAFDVAQGNRQNVGGNEDDEDDDLGGGSGTKEDPLDNILSQLKLLRNAAINANGGVTELLRVLGDSAKKMQTFRGVSQKLLAEGFSKEFIDSVMSMDEETRKTFISIKNGVITVTEAGRALNRSFNEIALGNYQNSLKETAIGINAQVTAMTKLTSAGIPLSTASEMVQDKTLAIAIASATTKKEITDLKNAFDALAAAEEAFVNVTPEGRQKQLESVIGEANAFFAAQETMYNQRYEASLKAYEDANEITKAQRDLADKEFALDDLQFALNSIADEESKINEQYDKRQEAIENIFKANKAIIDQDKERLDIAGALASGDLAAAAKAMQAQTVANLERNKEQQLNNLQRSRELEIAQVRDANGKSRLQLEEDILKIETEIADIQEKKLEPYQRQIDLLGRIRDDGIKAVQAGGFLGKTQSAWSSIANEVERAKFAVDGYQASLKAQLAAIPGITFGEDGSISVDAKQLVTPSTNPTPTPTPGSETKEEETDAATKKKQIDELNRRITTTRWRVKNNQDTKGNPLTSKIKNEYMLLNEKRIKEVIKLGGTPNMTDTTKPGSTKKIIDYLPGFASGGMVTKYLRMGGLLPYKSEGGSIFKPMGTDTVPAMLTPGEFVVRRQAVSNFGVDKLGAINTGTYSGESVYNYSVNVNVKSDANPDEIARSVMTQIKRIDSQRIRSNNY